jgi:8-oxo-dGTP diphosphatase
MKEIEICAAMVVNSASDLLMVRKRHSAFYQLPGGKAEIGETYLEALQRELLEELGLVITASQVKYLGTHEALAVNEADTRVNGHIFQVNLLGVVDLKPLAELEEAVWVTYLDYHNYQFAHLASEFVLPRWLQMG